MLQTLCSRQDAVMNVYALMCAPAYCFYNKFSSQKVTQIRQRQLTVLLASCMTWPSAVFQSGSTHRQYLRWRWLLQLPGYQ